MAFDSLAAVSLLQRKHSISSENAEEMKRRAFRHVYLREHHTYATEELLRLMAVFDKLLFSIVFERKSPTAELLNRRVREKCGISKPTARVWIQTAVSRLEMMTETPDGTYQIYTFNRAQEGNARAYQKYVAEIIPDIVRLQLDNPDDANAGRHLLEETAQAIYFNVVAEFDADQQRANSKRQIIAHSPNH
ncbi:hypothetical protein JQ557_05885 [Bradyrhizobium sp. U87765 SZCCT0131]|uniref:hypothetical protein n=1 Tax=unclassified Bradyrhizobium TaxID=2631580 RepID=UPI001BA79EB5|nr:MULTISPECIES: hypothetical protein [unclassified Bradyrhizobium]MBR1217507.1 hypothetical protein [Bradyrhizobium sp. U87765 SZCCT0131]MBR1264895.1 hypothetical protein [Bradyrhizobium sp. U87765 SZCCT0134]MBR1304877.1 hypothetical protein [Bradyrhizobium sp. U87765 SZCCT0110]MBR1320664.1 hypothetical protein [Bradyrhizobium sp. U87765 SZCCT0109]MBR1349084.1 hypothetical protein [Bradyrhizobium sp. U87765 SZCCT0048]